MAGAVEEEPSSPPNESEVEAGTPAFWPDQPNPGAILMFVALDYGLGDGYLPVSQFNVWLEQWRKSQVDRRMEMR
jgi:hypothetical protein